MRRKCDAATIKNLTLRGQMYYYRMDYKNSDGKRHAFRRSLGTSDLLTAVALINRIKTRSLSMDCFQMAMDILDDRPKITPDMTLEEKIKNTKLYFEANATVRRLMGELSPRWVFTPEQAKQDFFELRAREAGMLSSPMPAPEAYPSTVTDPQPLPSPAKGTTIKKMVDEFIAWKAVGKIEEARERTWIRRFVESLGVSSDSDFGLMCSMTAVDTITNAIKKSDNKTDWKRKNIGLLQQLLKYAESTALVRYRAEGLCRIQKVRRGGKSEHQGHLALDTDDLKRIFSPKYTHFEERPDYFWAFVIALYTGARRNAACTLQHKDTKMVCDIPCMEFIADDAAKELKTDETERINPIHSQMLALGFWDLVMERKKRFGAADTDFILPGCMTSTRKLDSHFSENVKKIFMSVGIKVDGRDANGKPIRDGKSFHSFRKTLSLKMQNAKLVNSMANRIVGWKGNGTMEVSYSPHQLQDIKAAMDQYNYDEIWPELQYWAKRTTEIILSSKV